MEKNMHFQIVISGVGGQGVLFITRLLAEAALNKGMPVFTSETHGMAQRGGSVISHLKIGDYASPLIVPGDADLLIALKAESIGQHGGYLKPGAWAVVNSSASMSGTEPFALHCCDADRLAKDIDNPRALNLILLGFALSGGNRDDSLPPQFYCSVDDMIHVLKERLKDKKPLLEASIQALGIGAQYRESH